MADTSEAMELGCPQPSTSQGGGEGEEEEKEASNHQPCSRQDSFIGKTTSNRVDSAVLCWGCHEDGQLGLGGIEEDRVMTPVQLEVFKNRRLHLVGCGARHTVFIMGDGSVYSCGNNDVGQLGHKHSLKKPAQIVTLDTQKVELVSCGGHHTLVINDKKQVFSWGDNSYGQLGRGSGDMAFQRVPRLVKSLTASRVIQVACGLQHSMALTSESDVYVWGNNAHGQLGIGDGQSMSSTPVHLDCLVGLCFVQLSAGGHHSLALTVSGTLFAWGRNSFGQLGVGDEKDRFFPTHVKTLRSQKVKYISCGENHSAALTKEGGVFTFGAGMYGQLGHNTQNHEKLPRKVFELMGSTVTQIACGRYHTLAYIACAKRIVSFGLGGNGQLGSGSSANLKTPSQVLAQLIPSEAGVSSQTMLVRRIFTGGDQAFVHLQNPQISSGAVDFCLFPSTVPLLKLDESVIEELVSYPANERISSDLSMILDQLFSNPACLSVSFLVGNDDHYNSSSRNHGIDMDLALNSFQAIAQPKNSLISHVIASNIERKLCRRLVSSPPDVEALRIYLILPQCSLFEDRSNFSTVILPFGKALLNLVNRPAQIIDLWWSQIGSSHFSRLVEIYKNCVLHLLEMPNVTSQQDLHFRQQGLHTCMELIKKLNKVNEENGQIVPYDQFYIPQLKEMVDIRSDYINWVQQTHSQQSSLLSFCNYPFAFDAQAKTILLHVDAVMQMQNAIEEIHRRNFTSAFMPMIDPVHPCLILYVTRHNIVQDTINQLAKQGNTDFKKPLRIVFVGEEALDGGGVRKVMFLGEEAVDEGGVRKEFFMLIIREILDPKYGMFKNHEDSHLLWFNGQTFEDSNMFNLIGVLCGLAIYNATIIDLPFPLALYKKLLRRAISLEDVKELEPMVGRSLEQLLQYEGDDLEDVFALTFEVNCEVFGEIQHVELIPGGATTRVTQENKQEYVDAYIEYTFNKSAADQCKAFNDGFHRVCGGRVLELFHPQELQAMVVGNENYDWEELENNTEYKGGFNANHRTIRFFWEVFRELDQEHKKKFLLFLTGSDRIPIHGMKAIKMVIQASGGGDDFLPVAHTCFNLLDLPVYQSREKLSEKLLQAIQHTQGFGLV